MDKCIRKYVGEGHLHLLHLCYVEVMTVLDGMHMLEYWNHYMVKVQQLTTDEKIECMYPEWMNIDHHGICGSWSLADLNIFLT